VNNFGPDDRRLLETAAASLYRRAVESGWIEASNAVFAKPGEACTARDLLVDIGLLVLDPGLGRYYPIDPAAVQAQIVVPLGIEGAEMLSESARWAETFSVLGRTYRQSPQTQEQPVVELRDADRINKFIQAALTDCRHELLTAQPDGRRPEKVLKEAVQRDLDTLDRGVVMRTLYQHAARHSPVTREYVSQITASGAEVRTLDEFFKRLIVIDRRLAIIPGQDGDQTAMAIHNQSLVAYLVDIFERSWERALPFADNQSQTHRDIAGDTRRMTIRMLVEGHSDPASAKRLGISTRTYAAYIASLKDEYGVQTRFQLGYAMSPQGAGAAAALSDAVGPDAIDSGGVDSLET